MSDDGGRFEAGPGCGPWALAVLIVLGIIFIVLARKYGWAR